MSAVLMIVALLATTPMAYASGGEPRTCEECLEEFLTQERIGEFGGLVGGPNGPTNVVCADLDRNAELSSLDMARQELVVDGLSYDDISDLLACLEAAGIVFTGS